MTARPMGVEVVEYGVVTSKLPITIKTGESRVTRAAWGVLSLNPIVLAAAVGGVEEGLGKSNAFQYTIRRAPPGTGDVFIQSLNVVEVGECLQIRSESGTGNVVVISQEPEKCAGAPSQTDQPPAS
jgi:uncharacterized protein (AIM24 family)